MSVADTPQNVHEIPNRSIYYELKHFVLREV